MLNEQKVVETSTFCTGCQKLKSSSSQGEKLSILFLFMNSQL